MINQYYKSTSLDFIFFWDIYEFSHYFVLYIYLILR